MKPAIKVGQEWERAGDGRGRIALRIRIVSGPHCGRVDVETLIALAPARWGRKRSLLASAFSNTHKGYRLTKDVP